MTAEKSDSEISCIADEALEFAFTRWGRESLKTLYRVLHEAALPDVRVRELHRSPRDEASGHGGIPTGDLSPVERRMVTELRNYLRGKYPDKSVELLHLALHRAAAMLVVGDSLDEE